MYLNALQGPSSSLFPKRTPDWHPRQPTGVICQSGVSLRPQSCVFSFDNRMKVVILSNNGNIGQEDILVSCFMKEHGGSIKKKKSSKSRPKHSSAQFILCTFDNILYLVNISIPWRKLS